LNTIRCGCALSPKAIQRSREHSGPILQAQLAKVITALQAQAEPRFAALAPRLGEFARSLDIVSISHWQGIFHFYVAVCGSTRRLLFEAMLQRNVENFLAVTMTYMIPTSYRANSGEGHHISDVKGSGEPKGLGKWHASLAALEHRLARPPVISVPPSSPASTLTDEAFLEHITVAAESSVSVGIDAYDRLRALAGYGTNPSLPRNWRGTLNPVMVRRSVERACRRANTAVA
jgi:hypothetical protein